MKTILIFPILFLIFGVSEHQSAVVEDCDEDDFTSSPHSHRAKHQLHQHTQRKNNINTSKPQQSKYKDTFHQSQRPQHQEVPHKKQVIHAVRKSIKINHGPPMQQFQMQRRRLPPQKRTFSRMSQRPMIWPPKPKPMNLVIKPLMEQKAMDYGTKQKLTKFIPAFPYKKQKRIKVIPAYEEYEAYPETEYVHEIVYPPEPRTYDYMEMENPPPGYSVPCEHDDSEYREQSTEVPDMHPRGMVESSIEINEKDEEMPSTEKSNESEMQTERELEVTTPVTPVYDTTPNIETRNGDIPINSAPEAISNFMEMLIQGLLAFISCMKSKAPMLEEFISKMFNSAISSCNSS